MSLLIFLHQHSWRRWLFASIASVMPISMAPVALVLAGHWSTGSYAVGALMTSAHALTEAVSAPWQGRLIDRLGVSKVAWLALGAEAILLCVLAAALYWHADAWLLVLLSGLFSGAAAGVPGGLRSSLPGIVGAALLQSAFSVDAAIGSLIWLIGPLIASATFSIYPGVPVAAMAVFAICAAIACVEYPGSDRTCKRGAGLPPLSTPFLHACALTFANSLTLGGVFTALPAFVESLGYAPSLVGVLASLESAAGVCGGLTLAWILQRWRVRARDWINGVMIVISIIFGLLGAVHRLDVSCGVMVIAGLLIVPFAGMRSSLIVGLIPSSQLAEGFSIIYACIGIGFATGAALVSLTIQRGGPVESLFVSAGISLAVGIVAGIWQLVGMPYPTVLND